MEKKIIWAQILCYKNQGIHWYHCNPTFLRQINFTLVRRLISALNWDISGLWNRSDGRDFREKRIDISRFLALYIHIVNISPRFSYKKHTLVVRCFCLHGWPLKVISLVFVLRKLLLSAWQTVYNSSFFFLKSATSK